MVRKAQRALWFTRRRGLAAASAAALALGLLAARGVAAPTPRAVTVSHPWMRFLTPRIPAAGYFTLRNGGASPVVLIGAASPDCRQLMLHRSVTRNGIARMEMMPRIVVPAHGAVTFRPGGYHLMCVSPSAAVAPGRSVRVSLLFRDGSSLAARFPVHGATGR
ncbi:MAG TPA: copper chaperone PCu(A)C [Acetobacteraceae bacterium]|nr:copper chaperone PCu(A)C [Acetobacteraceae bacterium]